MDNDLENKNVSWESYLANHREVFIDKNGNPTLFLHLAVVVLAYFLVNKFFRALNSN